MAVIQTIRNKFGKIAGAIIAIALIGFIISDARNGTFGNLFGGHESYVMKVDGVTIDQKEYQLRLKEYETIYTMFNKGRSLDEATRAQMNEQVLQTLVFETVAGEQCDKLGITTTEEEKNELVYGFNADPMIRQFQIEGNQIFINQQTGQFDPQIIKWMEKQFKDDPDKVDPTGKLREQWNAVKSYVVRMNRINKYNILVTQSIYPPVYLAKRTITDQNTMASIKYVKVPFTTVSDAEVKVSDDEVKDYIQKHAAAYETDVPTRSIEYVSFEIIPSSADTARILNSLNETKPEFAATKDNKGMVNNRSDEQGTFNEAYLNKRTFMSKYADTIMSLPVGEVFGPYYENGGYKLTKVVDRKTYPDSVKARHILVQVKAQGKEVRPDSIAKARIDSAVAMINSGANFDSICVKYTDDENSRGKGGEYTVTLIEKPRYDSSFADFIFNGKKGDKKIVKADNPGYTGYHYIEILDQTGTGPSIQVATITKNLLASDSTQDAILGKANEFAGRNATAAAFDEAVKKQNLDKRQGDNIRINAFNLPGLGASREIIRWIFEHKVGDISQVFQQGEQRFVVVKLTSIADKGTSGISQMNRMAIEQRLKDDKRVEIIKKKYTGAGSLDAIASGSGQQVQQADSVMLGGAYIPNVGYEPRVVGYTFNPSLQVNAVSPGIKGVGGVYFITVLNRVTPALDPNAVNQMIGQQRTNYDMQMKNAVGQMLQQVTNKEADVKYNAANF